MSQRLRCPKCGSSNTWVEREGDDILQRCLCGLHKYLLYRTKSGHTIMRAAVKPAQVVLPAKGTKIHRCLVQVLQAYPDPVYTSEVARRSELQNKETSALLVALMARGLVERVQERRGLAGGSTWKLTVRAEVLLEAKRQLQRRVFYGGEKMALVILVPPGDSFYVGDIKCTVTRIKADNIFRVEVDKGTMIEAFEVREDRRTEVLPGVFLSAGFRHNMGAKIVVEAPPEVKILRERLYESQ